MAAGSEPFVDVELVHAACGGHLRWLAFSFFPTKADLIQRGIALLFEDLEARGDAPPQWPKACGLCGARLQFESRPESGIVQRPVIVECDGHTAKHG